MASQAGGPYLEHEYPSLLGCVLPASGLGFGQGIPQTKKSCDYARISLLSLSRKTRYCDVFFPYSGREHNSKAERERERERERETGRQAGRQTAPHMIESDISKMWVWVHLGFRILLIEGVLDWLIRFKQAISLGEFAICSPVV